jgi:hypothetical protein
MTRRGEAGIVTAGLLGLLAVWFWPLLTGDWMGQSHILWSTDPWRALRPDGFDVAIRSGEGDAAAVFHPLLTAAREQVHAGRFPVWNPWSYAGMPLHGDIQTALFYPLTWFALLLPVGQAWGLMAVGKLLIAGTGAWALARQLGLSRGPALVAAVVFMLSAPCMTWLQWPLTTVFGLLPWLLWATERLWREPDRRRFAALALVVGLSLLAGHPETAMLQSSAVGVYLLVRIAAERAPRARIARGLGLWVGAHALGVLLAAVALVPFLEGYRDSITAVAHGEFAELSMPWEGALLWALPEVYGDGIPDYAGPLKTYVTTAGFFGVTALVLALVALVRLRRVPVAVGLAAMAACALAVVFAIPPVSWIMRNVPPYASGNNLRVLHVVALAGALGAGAAVGLLQRRPLPLRTVAAWLAGTAVMVGAAVALAAAAARLPAPRSTEIESVARFAVSLLAAGGCLVALGRIRPRYSTALVVGVAVLELAYLRGYNVILPPDEAYPPRTPAIAALQEHADGGRVSVLRPGPFEPLLQPDTPALYDLEAIQGYDYPQPRRWADFSWHVLRERGPSREIILTSPPPEGPSLTGLRMMNTRLYIGPPGAPRPQPAFRTVYAGRDGTVFEDPDALPRAFVVGRVRRLEEPAALALLARGGLDPRREALVEPGAPEPAPAPAFRPAEAERVTEEHWRIRVPDGGGWLVVANSFGPQWRAEVDGEPVEIHPTNVAAIGLALPPGAREVDLRVSHASLHAGAAVSGVAALALIGLAWPRRRRERA